MNQTEGYKYKTKWGTKQETAGNQKPWKPNKNKKIVKTETKEQNKLQNNSFITKRKLVPLAKYNLVT